MRIYSLHLTLFQDISELKRALNEEFKQPGLTSTQGGAQHLMAFIMTRNCNITIHDCTAMSLDFKDEDLDLEVCFVTSLSVLANLDFRCSLLALFSVYYFFVDSNVALAGSTKSAVMTMHMTFIWREPLSDTMTDWCLRTGSDPLLSYRRCSVLICCACAAKSLVPTGPCFTSLRQPRTTTACKAPIKCAPFTCPFARRTLAIAVVLSFLTNSRPT